MEQQIIEEVTKDDFFEQGVDSCVWTDVFLDDTCTIPAKQARGVLSSLVKKEYICPMGKGRDSYIEFTDRGKTYLKEILHVEHAN